MTENQIVKTAGMSKKITAVSFSFVVIIIVGRELFHTLRADLC